MTLQNINNLTNKKDEIFQTYSLKPTMIQNRSMLKSYEKTHKRQTHLRSYISNVLSLKLPSSVKLTLLNSTEKKLVAHFSSVDKNSQTKINQQLKDKNIQYSINLKSDTLEVEFKL